MKCVLHSVGVGFPLGNGDRSIITHSMDDFRETVLVMA